MPLSLHPRPRRSAHPSTCGARWNRQPPPEADHAPWRRLRTRRPESERMTKSALKQTGCSTLAQLFRYPNECVGTLVVPPWRRDRSRRVPLSNERRMRSFLCDGKRLTLPSLQPYATTPGSIRKDAAGRCFVAAAQGPRWGVRRLVHRGSGHQRPQRVQQDLQGGELGPLFDGCTGPLFESCAVAARDWRDWSFWEAREGFSSLPDPTTYRSPDARRAEDVSHRLVSLVTFVLHDPLAVVHRQRDGECPGARPG